MPRARCWLCERSETEDAKEFHSFAIRYAPTVDSMSRAATFHDTLMEKTRGKRKLAVDPEEESEEAEAEAESDADDVERTEDAKGTGGAEGEEEAFDTSNVSEAGSADLCDDVTMSEQGPGVPSIDEIYTHLSLHVLHPTVRVAHALRGLVELSETLRELTVAKGEDGESPLVDVRTVTMYLKVISEIMQIYRSADPSKMLFSGTDARG